MKKIVEELASKAGVNTQYSGSTRVMYLRGEKAAEFKAWIKEKYSNLAFELKLDEGLGLRFEHGELVSVHGDRNHALVHADIKARREVVLSKEFAEAIPETFGSTKIRRKKTATILGLASAIGITGLVNELLNILPIDEAEKQGIITKNLLSDEAGQQRLPVIEVDKFPFNELPATKEQVDQYLLSNPIDRSAKNPYNNAAKALNQKPDYIRGRWRSLRERGLVEKENA
jgi:hypothetical protein